MSRSLLSTPILFLVTAGFSTAPQVSTFIITWNIQRGMAPSLTTFLYLSFLNLYQLPTPLPQSLWTCFPWFLFKTSLFPSLSLYFSEVHTYRIYVLTSHSFPKPLLADEFPSPPLHWNCCHQVTSDSAASFQGSPCLFSGAVDTSFRNSLFLES